MTTLPFPAGDPLEFFARLRASEKNVAYVTAGEWTVIAWDPSETIVGDAPASLEILAAAVERRRTQPSALPFPGGLIGYTGYDLGCELLGVNTHAKDDQHIPGLCFHAYDRAVLIRGNQLTVVGDAAFTAAVQVILKRPPPPLPPAPVLRFRARMTKAAYAKAFRRIKRCIRDGEFYQLNFAQRFDAVSSADRRELFAMLARRNPAACMSFFESKACTLLSLSPETFVRIDGSRIVTLPIKGTRPRGATAKDDQRLRQELLGSAKERAELSMITDLLRNDLGQLCRIGSVTVEAACVVQPNPTVWHTHSAVAGELEPGASIMDVLRRCLPGGSVTGCPKRRAVQEIDALEPLARGPYTGVLCMLGDGGHAETSILIRTLVSTGKKLSLSVGGGIVADSTLNDEYRETLDKAKAFFDLARPKAMTWINGVSADPLDPRLALLDPLRAKGKAVFETLRTYNGVPFESGAHGDRLQESARLLGFALPAHCLNLGRAVSVAAQVCGSGPLRIKVLATPSDVLVDCRPLVIDPKIYRGVSAMFVKAERVTPLAKALPYEVCARANAAARKHGHEEALLLDSAGRVPEGAYSNVFWVSGGVLHTAGERVLLGITRAVVLKLAKRLKLKIRFAMPLKQDLLEADEVFITKTTTGPVPVTRIGRARIGSGKPGAVTRKILKAYADYSG
ncbi:MAG TPA: chorismate-binding protein [Candidatus Peribacteria bacterium]|nr:chorismate-binding protein [Candidatus Peribacteria bacterium]